MRIDRNAKEEIEEGLIEYNSERKQRLEGKLSEQRENAEKFYGYLKDKIKGNDSHWITRQYEIYEGNFTPAHVLQRIPSLHPLQGRPIEKAVMDFLEEEERNWEEYKIQLFNKKMFMEARQAGII